MVPKRDSRNVRSENVFDWYDNEKNIIDEIEIIIKNKFELAIMCGFGIILDDKILNKIDVYNVHPGELPKYKGRHPTFFATINGEKTINFTLILRKMF